MGSDKLRSDEPFEIPVSQANDALALALSTQAKSCLRLDSPLYATILERSARDAKAGGIVAHVLQPYTRDSFGSALGLRWLAAVHRIALRGDAPDLAARYPSCGGDGNIDLVWTAFCDVLDEHFDEVRSGTAVAMQTNEVDRSAALLGGFLAVADATRLPLRIFEFGASAGLNLRWDRYRYESLGWAFGDATSRLTLRDNFLSTPPISEVPVRVVERRGCDLHPIDPRSVEGRRTLVSFIWPDQLARIDRLKRACEIAREVDVVVDRSDATAWLESDIVAPIRGATTVVFHSVMLQYVESEKRRRLQAAIATIGDEATADAPFAHVFMEPPTFGASVRLWPGGESRSLFRSTAHGREITAV